MSTSNLFSLSNPAIRHLAWLCSAPQLLQCPLSFTPQRHLPTGYCATLLGWDADPQSAPALLREPPPPRLGHYVERLYRVLLEHLLGWDILLQNQQIHSNGHTIGELDFVVYNRHRQRVEHHEIAIKFYLGHSTQWFGPNAHDRLDLKTDSLLNRQSQRSHTPEALELLKSHGLDGPLVPRIFMPGYLFYPRSKAMITATGGAFANSRTLLSPTLPQSVPGDHLQGHWIYARHLNAEDGATRVVIRKPHWIGPWQQAQPPCQRQVAETLQQIEYDQSPRLLAELQQHTESGHWREVERCFVMPQKWPG